MDDLGVPTSLGNLHIDEFTVIDFTGQTSFIRQNQRIMGGIHTSYFDDQDARCQGFDSSLKGTPSQDSRHIDGAGCSTATGPNSKTCL